MRSALRASALALVLASVVAPGCRSKEKVGLAIAVPLYLISDTTWFGLGAFKAATSGSAKYFLGTDSAPHAKHLKEAACGCAGIFNAPFALESYVTVFDQEGALDRFEAFASENGPRFYGLPLNEDRIVLERTPVSAPEQIGEGLEGLKPFHAGETLPWRFAGKA